MPDRGTGHYEYQTGRLARLLAYQRSRGMSEGALARLPSLPQPKRREPPAPPVVLATSAHATRADLQEIGRKPKGPRDSGGRFALVIAATLLPGEPGEGAKTTRAKAIVGIVATAARLDP